MLPVASCNSRNRPNLALCPSLRIFPSLTAITGDPRFAKMLVPCAPGVVPIGIAAFAPFTRRVANRSTLSSAYFAAAATGKCPCTKPVNAPIN